MKVSYFKTQWWRLLIALVCLVMCCVYVFKPSPDTSTIEGLDTLITYMFNANLYFLGFIIWILISFINYNDDRVKLLEAEKERNDAMYELVQELVNANKIDREVMKKYEERLKKVEEHAITDLDPDGKGNYTARRRCGPDKDVPYPGEEPNMEERIKKTDQDITYLKAAMDVCGIVPGKSSTVTLTGEQLREFADKIMEDKK